MMNKYDISVNFERYLDRYGHLETIEVYNCYNLYAYFYWIWKLRHTNYSVKFVNKPKEKK